METRAIGKNFVRTGLLENRSLHSAKEIRIVKKLETTIEKVL